MKKTAPFAKPIQDEKLSPFHIVIDLFAFCYVIFWSPQYFIAFLFFSIMVFNVMQFIDFADIRYNMSILRWHSFGLFHSTLQLLPLSLSLGYYDNNDVFINLLFVIVATSFTTIIFVESKKINRSDDNNVRINNIYALCIILDYIHIILLLLCNLYTTNAYFFWKATLQSYPFCVGLQTAVFYHELPRWLSRVPSRQDIWSGFWFMVFIWIIVPVSAECINASWIILLYNEIFSKLRCVM